MNVPIHVQELSTAEMETFFRGFGYAVVPFARKRFLETVVKQGVIK